MPTNPKSSLPAKPTSGQRYNQYNLSLSKEEQEERWQTFSGTSDRWKAEHEALGAMIREHLEGVEEVYEYKMHGWVAPSFLERREWKGTMDPNWIRVYLAERKAGLTYHLWVPYEGFEMDKDALTELGFKPMVGCLQWNRKSNVPREAIQLVIESVGQSQRAAKE